MRTEDKTCIFCGQTKLYKVSSTQYRCVTCKRTFSHAKQTKERQILDAFIVNQSAHACATLLGLNYLTVAKTYQKLRLLLIEHSEALYAKHTQTFSQYDEYYFLPTCKRGKPKYLFDAIGILGMLYDKRIHTLLLPNQFAHLKNLEENSIEKETYARYLNQHKVAHYESFDNALVDFWYFLERWMDHFKGIKKENFIYYLKEAEFKFNYTHEEQKLILGKMILI
ncbi:MULTISPECIES: hypothetical protein [unclassified Sulfurospirillum]|uniref:hypothetical protein n=1 Tax=unclassified Sulfurospirillum TaxID=2618290 RepID=UPI0005018D8B|nr:MULTISPECIES: hypothetical protein [unclassified Sulfurospirillum]KFL35314.1 hypothetical protein JU57_00795 [Sulfurospirillum sp. SCADC]